MSQDVVIEAKGLTKRYDGKNVVDGISFEILKGECFGVLGPNGAGKSTTLKMMYCSSLVQAGELFILGLNVKKHVKEIKSKIGVVPQEDGLDPIFTVLENLIIFSRFHKIPEAEAELRAIELLRMMRLEDFKDRHVETLSGGMKRRLAIARSLMNAPDILFLDEPTTGLDPQARLWVWNFLRKMKQDMGTLVLTTHYMEEAEVLCDRVAIMDEGKILTVGKPQDLIRKFVGKEIVEFYSTEHDMKYYLTRLQEAGYQYQVIRDHVSIHIQENQEGRKVLDLISSPNITVRKPTLNDVFMKLSGHELRDE